MRPCSVSALSSSSQEPSNPGSVLDLWILIAAPPHDTDERLEMECGDGMTNNGRQVANFTVKAQLQSVRATNTFLTAALYPSRRANLRIDYTDTRLQ